MAKKTAWMFCKHCGRPYEIYANESAVYDNTADVYTKRGVGTDSKLIEEADFPDVQAMRK